ncbi:MAG: tRNA (N(6)-L-threonylcarbamoyladenosine(37)-C(2))-methylthiotransferase [Nitrososphaerota archaeon]
MRIYWEVYGCAANVADAEIAIGILRGRGHEVVPRPEDADVIVIFTCAVKKPTSDRMFYRISRLRELGKRIIVAGCMPIGEPGKVKLAAPDAVMIGPRSITRIWEAVERGISILDEVDDVKLGLPRSRRSPVVAIVPVSEGCAWRLCSFCIVARIRGAFRSYPLELVLGEVRRFLEEGAREIWLTSQDMGSYGIESGRSMLPELLKAVSSIEGLFFIRVGMMNPLYIYPVREKLAEAYLHPRIFKFLHLPVQSGSNRVLRSMMRGYTVEAFKKIVEEFRRRIPELTLSTDIIVGYPAEDEEDFEETIKLVEEVKPDMINISRFFARPGTPSERLKPLDPRLINERSRILSEVARRVALEKNEGWVGWSGYAIVDEIGERGEAIARNIYYRPIVIADARGEDILGRIVEVEVEDARPYCLMARLRRIVDLEEAREAIIVS